MQASVSAARSVKVVLGCAAWRVNPRGPQLAPRTRIFSAQFKRLAARRGRKCAIIAVAHSVLVIGYYLQRRCCSYADLGSNYFDRLHAEGLKGYLVKRLENLGHSVILEPRTA